MLPDMCKNPKSHQWGHTLSDPCHGQTELGPKVHARLPPKQHPHFIRMPIATVLQLHITVRLKSPQSDQTSNKASLFEAFFTQRRATTTSTVIHLVPKRVQQGGSLRVQIHILPTDPLCRIGMVLTQLVQVKGNLLLIFWGQNRKHCKQVTDIQLGHGRNVQWCHDWCHQNSNPSVTPAAPTVMQVQNGLAKSVPCLQWKLLQDPLETSILHNPRDTL